MGNKVKKLFNYRKTVAKTNVERFNNIVDLKPKTFKLTSYRNGYEEQKER